jgi:glycosyltransferase involved in cell wall biosynthesis
VSVIIAARDAEDTLGYAVGSILGQTYQDLEVLVCDDASTDGTIGALEAFRADPRLRVFQSQAPQGPYNIRNQLIGLASGEFVTFQDADDLSVPTRIERQVTALCRDNLRFVTSRWLRTTADGRIVFSSEGICVRPCLVSLLGRRTTFNALGLYRQAVCAADTDFFEEARLIYGHDAVLELRQPLVLGLSENGSLTRRPGLEATSNGYRAAPRRTYAEAAFVQRMYGPEIVPDSKVEQVLKDEGIFRDASEIIEVTR